MLVAQAMFDWSKKTFKIVLVFPSIVTLRHILIQIPSLCWYLYMEQLYLHSSTP